MTAQGLDSPCPVPSISSRILADQVRLNRGFLVSTQVFVISLNTALFSAAGGYSLLPTVQSVATNAHRHCRDHVFYGDPSGSVIAQYSQ